MARSRRYLAASAAAALLALPLAAPPASAAESVTVVTGLHNPRGVAVGANGEVYVAEAGTGGDTDLGGIQIGATGQITGYNPAKGKTRVVASGFISGATEEGVLGLGGLSTHGNALYAIVGGSPQPLAGAPASDIIDLANAQLGQLLKVTPSGQTKAVAGVGALDFDWTATQPGLVDPPDGTQDANPYGVLAMPGGALVADAGANTITRVDANGHMTILTTSGVPLTGPSGVSDAVPTCIAPDGRGGYLVGALSREFFHMSGNGTLSPIPLSGDPVATIGLCTPDGHGGVYAVDTASFFFGQPGSVFHISGTGQVTTILGGLFAPGGVAVAKDGRSLFVTVNSISMNDGALIQVPLP